jgi:hypothetical protein
LRIFFVTLNPQIMCQEMLRKITRSDDLSGLND